MQRFLRASEDELVWCREADTLLCNDDIGRDLQSVRFLLKIHQVVVTMGSVHMYKSVKSR